MYATYIKCTSGAFGDAKQKSPTCALYTYGVMGCDFWAVRPLNLQIPP